MFVEADIQEIFIVYQFHFIKTKKKKHVQEQEELLSRKEEKDNYLSCSIPFLAWYIFMS